MEKDFFEDSRANYSWAPPILKPRLHPCIVPQTNLRVLLVKRPNMKEPPFLHNTSFFASSYVQFLKKTYAPL